MKLLVDICSTDGHLYIAMCLAVPDLVESIDGDFVEVEFGGVSKRVCVSPPPGPQIGEYMIVHPGYGIKKMKSAEAKKMLTLFKEIAKLAEETE